jgi:hypothetical protein
MNDTIIHIGYHKTGTSYIQKNIFEAYDDFLRVPQREIFNTYIYPDPLEYSSDLGLEFYSKYKSLAEQESKILVLSNERLSGSPHSGGADSVEIANRLAKLPGKKKIIIGIREQKDMILSCYSQYVRAVGCASIDEYIGPSTSKSKYLFHSGFFRYKFLIDYYVCLFGKENVLVLPYEMLKRDPEHYNSKILAFVGCKKVSVSQISTKRVNEKMKPCIVWAKRFFNPFILRSPPNIGNTLTSEPIRFLFRAVYNVLNWCPTKRLDLKIEKKWKEKINKKFTLFYKQSNQELEETYKLKLKEYGYDLIER